MTQNFFTRLRIIHAALCIGCLFFAAVTYFIVGNTSTMDTSFSNPLSIVGVALGFAIIASSVIYAKKVKEIAEDDSLEQKKTKYQSAYIIMLALIEGPAIFNIVVFLITKNTFHLVVAGIFIFNLISKMPNKSHISQLLNCYPDDL